MRAMTPSPMRTMAAKCFARVGVVMNMLGERVFGGAALSVGSWGAGDSWRASKMRGSFGCASG
jgi:hypothetical protein